jgi:translation initiation factor 2D
MLASNDKIICTKVSGSKMLIYIGEEYPLLVDGTGKNNYFPSIYVCAAYQPLLKSLVINEGV